MLRPSVFVLAFVFVLSACGVRDGASDPYPKDDWVFDPVTNHDDKNYAASPQAGPPVSSSPGTNPAADSDLGFAVGGAKGIENFRENIKEGFLPLAEDITYEGMFYGYHFDTGKTQACQDLFCPSYVQMVSSDPFGGEPEKFMSVGLNSGLSADDFKRKKLNLVVVLDVSGSMGSGFNRYYYDGEEGKPEENPKTKMTVANESIVAMLDHLNDDDHFGMVLFESNGHLGKPLSSVAATDMNAIKKHVLEVGEFGGTNMSAGYELGASLFSAVAGADPAEYENRIIFLTDAMPNLGDTSEGSLLSLVQGAADEKIFTTFIGIGVDFNSALVEALTKVQGSNYYSVHSEEKFKARMDEEFEFMVTPLVFDLQLAFGGTDLFIDDVFGSPEADKASGVIMYVNTLFPSKVEAGETKGGVILLKLGQNGVDNDVELTATYKDRNENPFTTTSPFAFDADLDVAPNTGIRKAVLLTRFVRLMKEWIEAERALAGPPAGDLGQWERQSLPLTVSVEHKQAMQTLLNHMQLEVSVIGDSELQKEVDLLTQLVNL